MPVNTPSPKGTHSRLTHEALEHAKEAIDDALQQYGREQTLSELGEMFADEVGRLTDEDVFDERVVRRAARIAFAESAWRRHLDALLRATDVGDLLGVSKQRVSALTAEKGRLIALHARDGSIGYPAWQFVGGRVLDTLARSWWVLSRTGSEWSAASWCVTPHPELEQKSPLDWAAGGRSSDVLLRVAERDAARMAE